MTDIIRNVAPVLAFILGAMSIGGPATSEAGELWGAYAGYHFDGFAGDEGYGISWNYADAQSAVAEALRQCRERQPTPPVHTPAQRASGAHPGERCGDRVFAFSSTGPDPEHVVRSPDPDWGQNFDRLTVHRRHRCTGVVERSIHTDGFAVLGTNFHRVEGDTQAAVKGLIVKRFSKGQSVPQLTIPYPYRTAIIACNDR